MQLEIALLICNQIVVPIATIWLQQLKVANIAAINCTCVALGLLIFAVYVPIKHKSEINSTSVIKMIQFFVFLVIDIIFPSFPSRNTLEFFAFLKVFLPFDFVFLKPWIGQGPLTDL